MADLDTARELVLAHEKERFDLKSRLIMLERECSEKNLTIESLECVNRLAQELLKRNSDLELLIAEIQDGYEKRLFEEHEKSIGLRIQLKDSILKSESAVYLESSVRTPLQQQVHRDESVKEIGVLKRQLDEKDKIIQHQKELMEKLASDRRKEIGKTLEKLLSSDLKALAEENLRLEELVSEIRQAKIMDYENIIYGLNNKSADFIKNISEVRDTNEQLSDRNQNLQDEISEMKVKLIESETLRSRLENSQASLENQLKVQSQIVNGLRSTTDRLLKYNNEITQALESRGKELTDLSGKVYGYNIQIQTLKDEARTPTPDIDQLLQHIKQSYERDIDHIQVKHRDHMKVVGEQKARDFMDVLRRKEEQWKDAQDDLRRGLLAQVHSKQREIEDKLALLNSKDAEINQLQTTLRLRTTELENEKQTLDEKIRDEFGRMAREIDELNSSKLNLESQLSALHEKLGSQETKFRTQLESLIEENRSNEEISQLKLELQRMTQELTAKNCEIAGFKSRVEELETTYASNTVFDITTGLTDLIKTNAELEHELDSLRNRYNEQSVTVISSRTTENKEELLLSRKSAENSSRLTKVQIDHLQSQCDSLVEQKDQLLDQLRKIQNPQHAEFKQIITGRLSELQKLLDLAIRTRE